MSKTIFFTLHSLSLVKMKRRQLWELQLLKWFKIGKKFLIHSERKFSSFPPSLASYFSLPHLPTSSFLLLRESSILLKSVYRKSWSQTKRHEIDRESWIMLETSCSRLHQDMTPPTPTSQMTASYELSPSRSSESSSVRFSRDEMRQVCECFS